MYSQNFYSQNSYEKNLRDKLQKDMEGYLSFGYPPLSIIKNQSYRFAMWENADMVMSAIENTPIKNYDRINALHDMFSSMPGGYNMNNVGIRYSHGIGNMYLNMAQRDKENKK